VSAWLLLNVRAKRPYGSGNWPRNKGSLMMRLNKQLPPQVSKVSDLSFRTSELKWLLKWTTYKNL